MSLPTRFSRLRRLLPAAFAVVAVAVAGALALEAWKATERHRQAADRTLRDHAELAAFTFRERFLSRAWVAVDAVFRPVGHAGLALSSHTLPPLASLRSAAADLERCVECGPALRPRYYFRLMLPDTSLEVLDSSLSSTREAGLVAGVAAAARLLRHWRWDYTSFVDTTGPRTEMVYLAARWDAGGTPRAIYGFAVAMDAVVEGLLRPALDRPSLLPVARHVSRSNDSLLSVTLHHGRRTIELSSARLPDAYSARVHGSRMLGGWTIRVALDPRTAPRLLVGDVPGSRAPLLAAMVLVTAILVASTLYAAWRAMELARLRSEFVANVSHELRTPLAQILLFGESLTLGRMQARRDVRSAGRIIVGEARRLMGLVDNVMLFGRGVRPAPLPTTPEPLAPLLRETMAAFAPIAAAAHSRLTAVRVDEIAAAVDRAAIRQVLLNLLDNAVKYGPPGQTISLGLAAVGGRTRLWVEDEGPGIPPADRQRVWRPFVRLARDVDGQKAGSGIGLSLVRDVVARHGGAAWIEATPAGGARVVVELPEARPAALEEPCVS